MKATNENREFDLYRVTDLISVRFHRVFPKVLIKGREYVVFPLLEEFEDAPHLGFPPRGTPCLPKSEGLPQLLQALFQTHDHLLSYSFHAHNDSN